MEILHGHDKAIVQGGRRIALVASAVKSDAWMLADQADIIPGIVKEHLIVVRIRTVGRIRKPEVLPDHDSVLVTSLVELLVARLADPVTDHIQIHVSVHADSGVIFIGSVAEIIFTEPPVPAFREEAAAIDEHFKVAHHVAVSEFADSGKPLDGGHRLVRPVRNEREGGLVQVRLAVAVRPPKSDLAILQL